MITSIQNRHTEMLFSNLETAAHWLYLALKSESQVSKAISDMKSCWRPYWPKFRANSIKGRGAESFDNE